MKFEISYSTIFIFLFEFEFSKFINTYTINTRKDWDICSHWNGRRHFLELGERGELHAKNVSASTYRSYYVPPAVNVDNKTVSSENWYQCNLELVTCSECVIRITFTHANFSKTCEQTVGTGNDILKSKCSCEHILFSEPPYELSISGQSFCGDEKVFRSQTRTVLMKFYFRATNTHVFSLQYFSERNVNVISGSPPKKNESRAPLLEEYRKHIISTPYFPIPYPRDYGIEHILTCESDDCHVKLEFTDFQLGMISSMMVFDSNGQMLDSYNGDIFRPPIIVSTGKSLLLQFRGNGVSSIGYRAEISFISDAEYNEKSILPNTDCGGMVESLGGAITMMNMIENETETKYYDCIWIIKPAKNYMMMKTHISLRVDTFIGMESNSILEIRQGVISTASVIETIESRFKTSGKTHITQIMTGYYIHLKGVFGKSSRLAIVYSVFNYINCYIGSEFLCQNNHCLSIRLHCDGFDHCGDHSDEPETCDQQRSIQSDQREWYSHKPNYYFPKIEQYPDLKTATGIFVMSTLGILVVLSGWMIILYRMGVRARHQRELQSQLQTISELLDRDRQDDQPDNPPDYEAPPDYEEVIKLGNGNEIQSRRNIQRQKKRNRKTSREPKNNQNRPNNNDVPSQGAENLNDQRPEQLQSVSNQIINSTAIVEASIPTTSSEKYETNTIPTSQSTKGIHTENNFQSTSAYSSGTSTQYEERSSQFRDESLNISYSFATPKPNQKTGRKYEEAMYSDNQNLKKAWVVFDNGQVQTIQNKRKKLRHTFSSPETFLYQISNADDMHYGNVYSERDSYLSNATTFGSELSSDPISGASKTSSNNNLKLNQKDEGRLIAMQFLKLLQPKLKTSTTNNQVQQFEVDKNLNKSLSNVNSHADEDEDIHENHEEADPDISCFGAVNLFNSNNSNKKELNRSKTRKRSSRRSSSFTSCDRRRKSCDNGALKRYSSADMLIRSPSPYQFRTSSPPIV